MTGILLPRNCFHFPLVKVILSKITYVKFENTKNEHFFTKKHRKVAREIFQELRMDHIDKKVDGNDQGYPSHQLLNESDVYRRQTMSLKKGATRCHENSP